MEENNHASNDHQQESVAEKFAGKVFYARVLVTIIGLAISCILIYGGFLLTQEDIKKEKNVKNEHSKIEAQIGNYKFALQNTAPGLLLIICGTIIGAMTISKQTRVKTYWKQDENGASRYETEVQG
ncbi:hypothetical protein WCX49_02645 [Sulfurimonas sp. HSL-1656]|uniref:hypothetical protein n=1 Tax=Thiomicrolovo subterrani TaxID=3131934 RepID=UPI0031F7EFB1